MEMLTGRAAEMTRQEWRDFGVYYVSDDLQREWHVHGHKAGLHRLAHALEQFASSELATQALEHRHLGPHFYFTLTGWSEPRLDGRGVWGGPEDFRRMSHLICHAAAKGQPGDQIRISHEYAASAEYTFVVHVQPDVFDPASLDPQLAG
jgi:hypothetical protein